MTVTAVKSFQSSKGLVADGIVGPVTWAALRTSIRAVSDSPALWQPSATISLTNHLASFEVSVSSDAFDENYRLEVLDGDKVIGVARTTRLTKDVFE